MKKIAFVFPGQGSQSLGMLRDSAEKYSMIQPVFNRASDVLGYDLWDLVQQGSHEKLNQTEYTQPALLTASIALWELWKSEGREMPMMLAGHSLGEYSAWVCAQAISFEDGVRLVAMRGRLMQEAMPNGVGGMGVIIGLEAPDIDALCLKAAETQIVQAANYNARDQIVIAGHKEAVQRVMALAQSIGAKLVLPLPMSVPSHCVLMQSAAEKLGVFLESIKILPPQIPVINNVDVKIEVDPNKIKSALVRQLYNPVRWMNIMRLLATHSAEIIIECGPGKVLTNLCKRILPEVHSVAIGNPQGMTEAVGL